MDGAVLTPEAITTFQPEGEVIYINAHATAYDLRVSEHDANWSLRAQELVALVRTALREPLVDIQHVGSTAVPGLPAKPIIDIDLTVTDPTDEPSYVPGLEGLGFVHWLTEPDWHQHRLLKLLEEPRVHLHVFGPECPEVVRHRMFRDWLIAHAHDRQQYATAKRDAAAQLRAMSDVPGVDGAGMRYNRLKEPVVHEIYQRIFRAAGLVEDLG